MTTIDITEQALAKQLVALRRQEIIRKNDEIKRLRKAGRTKNGKIRTVTYKKTVILSTSKRSVLVNTDALPLKFKISNKFAEKYRIKQEIKRTHDKCDSPKDLHLLAELVEESVKAMHWREDASDWNVWKRFFAYEDIYEVAFNRGVRHERQRRKLKESLSAFDIIGAEDITELSHELGVSEDKLTYAVMEVISKRKNGGKA